MPAEMTDEVTIEGFKRAYASGECAAAEVMRDVREKIAACPRKGIWIEIGSEETIAKQVAAVEARKKAGAALPLYGIPFAVKDNIDAAGFSTTAACPAFSYKPEKSAMVVQKLTDAGAIVIGKTNLDQFATGLIGVRSPYGACENWFDPAYISGGSSSGSAVAVAAGIVPFALGTDTAGSGRIPAAFNNIVGLKPSRGLLSNTGVVPACRSLDCVAIFARDSADAAAVLKVASGVDTADPWSRPIPHQTPMPSKHITIGIPQPELLEYFGNTEMPEFFHRAIERFKTLGAVIKTIDFTPFRDTARLLYGGPWVVERLEAAGTLYRENSDALLPVFKQIVSGAANVSAANVFQGFTKLAALRRAAEESMRDVDFLLTPTAGTIYKIAEVQADPIQLNTNLGYYTNYVNLLDMCGIALPAGFQKSGLPLGVTLLARAFSEAPMLELAQAYERAMA